MTTWEWLHEKKAVKEVVGELVIDCLWNPQVTEACGETNEHYIKVWRDGGIIKAEISRK